MVSRAASRSLKASAAVQLLPTMSARVERLRSVARRKTTTSWTKMAVHMKSMATTFVTMNIRMSFFWIARSANRIGVPLPRYDVPRQLQELRADLQARLLRGRQADVEPDPALFDDERHRPAGGEEVL